jgi:hypothetical protein
MFIDGKMMSLDEVMQVNLGDVAHWLSGLLSKMFVS